MKLKKADYYLAFRRVMNCYFGMYNENPLSIFGAIQSLITLARWKAEENDYRLKSRTKKEKEKK